MVGKVAGFIPNLFTAAVILGVGWFVARIVQRVVSSLLSAVGLDALGEKGGLSTALGTQRLSGVVGLIAYILIFLPVVIAALNALRMEAITVPASNMLTMILEAIPAIFGAVLVLTIAYLVGRVVSGLVANLLAGAGFNGILAKLGLGKETGDGERTPSAIVGTLILVAIMLFAVTEASGLMGFAVPVSTDLTVPRLRRPHRGRTGDLRHRSLPGQFRAADGAGGRSRPVPPAGAGRPNLHLGAVGGHGPAAHGPGGRNRQPGLRPDPGRGGGGPGYCVRSGGPGICRTPPGGLAAIDEIRRRGKVTAGGGYPGGEMGLKSRRPYRAAWGRSFGPGA